MLSRRLVTRGYEVVMALCGGQEGVDQARQVKPDLVLMDMSLPGEGRLGRHSRGSRRTLPLGRFR